MRYLVTSLNHLCCVRANLEYLDVVARGNLELDKRSQWLDKGE